MAQRRATRGFPQRGPKRLNAWVGPPEQGYVAVASTGSTLIGSLSVEEAITLVRTRGMFSVKPNSVAADVDIVGAIGAGVVSAEAFAIGITALPTPFSDADWPGWFVWESFAFHVENVSAAGFDPLASLQIPVDSKGMRKIGASEVVVFVAESQIGTFDVVDATRGLFKLG